MSKSRSAARLAACQASGTPCPASVDLSKLVTGDVLIGLAALASLVLISIVARRFLRQRFEPRPGAHESRH